MYRSKRNTVIKRLSASAAVTLAVAAAGIGVAAASTHTSSAPSASTTMLGTVLTSNDQSTGTIEGVISAMSPTTISVTSSSGTTTFTVNTTTSITDNGVAGGISNLALGDEVTVTPSSSDATVAASVAITSSSSGAPSTSTPVNAEGVISALSATSFTVTTGGGSTVTYAIDASTTVRAGDNTVPPSFLAIGESVSVESSSTAGTAGSIDIELSHLTGQVTGVSNGVITITTTSGATVDIQTSSLTNFYLQGSSASVADVQVGSYVGALGVELTSGTFNALSVGLSPSATTSGDENGQGDDNNQGVGLALGEEAHGDVHGDSHGHGLGLGLGLGLGVGHDHGHGHGQSQGDGQSQVGVGAGVAASVTSGLGD